MLACSDACEAALKARCEGYDEIRIRHAWNACTAEERRPRSQHVFTESGVHPVAREESTAPRHEAERGPAILEAEAARQGEGPS